MSFITSLIEEFKRVMIEGDRYEFLIDGLKNTFTITFGALAIGIVIGIVIAAVKNEGYLPVILCPEEARILVKISTEREMPNLVVLSIPEIDTENNMGYAVFENCTSLEKVELKGDLLYIQPHTFDGCNFENLNCFETINIIDHDAFANNTALKDITMRTATIISDSAFENCSDLIVARFPNITYIDYFAFRNF